MKKSSRLLAAVILSSMSAMLFLPTKAISQDLSVDGYSLSMVNISTSGGMVEVSGRLEYGPSCGNLKLTFKLQNGKGKKKTVNCFVKNAGTGSSLFEGSSKISDNDDKDWGIDDVTAKCSGGKK